MKRKIWNWGIGGLKSLFAVAMLGLANAAGAQDTAAPSADAGDKSQAPALLDRELQVDLEGLIVSKAVIELSHLASVQVVMAGGSLDGFNAPSLHGRMSLRQALEQVLQGTSSSFQQTAEKTVTVTTSLPAEIIPVVPVSEAESEDESRESYGQQRLDDVIVTATKREKSAREIPVSISAIRGEDLEKMGARDMKDYMMLVPGLSMDEAERGEGGGRRLIIRGVGPATVDGNQTAGQFIGDIPMTDPVGNRMTPDLDPFDLKTVEVLKGPQGTTFGATALNGAIRYVPNMPELEQWQARGFVDLNDLKFSTVSTTYGAALNMPIGESVALRGAGVLQNFGGLYDNLQRNDVDADSKRKWSARGILRWMPWEALSVDVTYLKQNSHANDLLTGDNPDTFSNNGKPGPSYFITGFDLASIDLRYTLGDWGSLVWQSSDQVKYVDGDIDVSTPAYGQLGIELLRGFTQTEIKGRTHEVRWVSADGGRWNWIIGGFIQNYRLDTTTEAYVRNPAQLGLLAEIYPFLNVPVLTPEVFSPRGINAIGQFIRPLLAEERSIFGELSRRFGSHWEVTVGARRYDTSIDSIVGWTGLTAAELFLENGFKQGLHIQQSDKGISPKLSVAWKPGENLMVYALMARGFQFGGVNSPPTFNFPNPIYGTHPVEYQSSRLWNREIGVRTDWLDRTLRFDATVFDIDWSDAQIQQYPQDAIFSYSYTDNVGRVSSRGVEANLTWLTPVPGLSMNLAAAYTKARTRDATVNNGTEIPAGAPLPAAPPVQVAGTLAYSTYFGSWISSAGLSYTYWSKSYSDLQKTFEIYDFDQYGLNLSTARPDWAGAPTLTFGIQNLTDERGLIGRRGSGTRGASDSLVLNNWSYIRPRALSLRLTAQFD